MWVEVIAHLVGEAAFSRLPHSRQTQLLLRLFFGLIGGALAVAGAVAMSTRSDVSPDLGVVATALFLMLGCFFVFNVGMARQWRWPGLGIVVCFVLLFAVRIVGGP